MLKKDFQKADEVFLMLAKNTYSQAGPKLMGIYPSMILVVNSDISCLGFTNITHFLKYFKDVSAQRFFLDDIGKYELIQCFI